MKEIKFRYRFDRGKHFEKITGEKRFITVIMTLEEIEDYFHIYYCNYKVLSRDRYTGLHDKNGKEIYEGDIFHSINREGYKEDIQGEIYFYGASFYRKYGYKNPKNNQRKDYFFSSVLSKDFAEKIEVI